MNSNNWQQTLSTNQVGKNSQEDKRQEWKANSNDEHIQTQALSTREANVGKRHSKVETGETGNKTRHAHYLIQSRGCLHRALLPDAGSVQRSSNEMKLKTNTICNF